MKTKTLIILFFLSLASLPGFTMPNPAQKLRAEIQSPDFNKSKEVRKNKPVVKTIYHPEKPSPAEIRAIKKITR